MDMSKKKVENQTVVDNDKQDLKGGGSQCAGASGDNVSEGGTQGADELSDSSAQESSSSATEKDTARLESEGAEWRDKYLRLQAEFDNYRKRTLKEKMSLIESGGEEVIKSLLPVIDDVDRALTAMEKSNDIEAIRNGVKLIAQKFSELLRQKGVVEIATADQPFDVDEHEAVARFPSDADKKGKVIDVVQKGYKMGDKVIRYAKVVVGE